MQLVFLDSADPILIRDLEGRVVDSNHEVERVFGWTREELLGRDSGHLLAPEWRELAQMTVQKCRRGEPVRNVEFAVRTKNGVVVPVLATGFLLTDELGQPVAIANILKDITQLKQATERLQKRNEQLEQFANVLAHDLSAPLQTIRRLRRTARRGMQRQVQRRISRASSIYCGRRRADGCDDFRPIAVCAP